MYQPFSLQGCFQGFEPHPNGKLKTMILLTDDGERRIKLDKPLRRVVGPYLQAGQALEVQGVTKLKPGKEQKTIAERIRILQDGASMQKSPQPPPKPTLRCVQICGKSDCRRRGGDRVLEAFEQALADHPELEPLRLKVTGCMKNCKAGPNLVMMPDKARYCQVSPAQVSDLMQRHFSDPQAPPHTPASTAAAEREQR